MESIDKKQPVYLDYNATTPVDPEVRKKIIPFIGEIFGNPSSSHYYGIKARNAIEIARIQVSELIGCEPTEIIFTSGGTESNNYAIKGIALNQKKRGNHIITSSIEHPAVIEVCRYLAKNGFEITFLPVDSQGIISIDNLLKSIKPSTILISIMHANNETGTIQPIYEIGEIANKYKISFHTDAAQTIGKLNVDVRKMGVDLLSIAGHKFYAPKGIGALYIKKGIELQKLIHGANHERNYRAGTENLSGIIGIGEASSIAKRDFIKNVKHLLELKAYLYKNLKAKIPDIQVNGHPERCLPNTLNISFPSSKLPVNIEKLSEIAVSTGSACHAKGMDISYVLKAIGLNEYLANRTIRFSTGKFLTFQDIDIAVNCLVEVLNKGE